MSKSSRFAANGAPHTEPIPVDVAALVAAQDQVNDGLLAVDLDAAPGCLPELLEQLVMQHTRLTAAVSRFMAGLTKHGDPDVVGRFSASAWLQSRTRMSQAESNRIAKVASAVFGDGSTLRRTRAELSAGRIHATHAEEIAKAADKFEPEIMTKLDIENQLVNVALTHAATDVKKLAAEIDEYLKPDKHEDDEKSDYERRSLAAAPTFGDTVDIRGFASGLEGEEILDFLRRVTIAPQGPDDTRNKGQRCFDGFMNFIRTHRDAQPSMGGFRPGIIVTTEYSDMIRLLGQHTGQEVPAEPTIDDIRRIIAAHTGVHPDEILYNEENNGRVDEGDEEISEDDGDTLDTTVIASEADAVIDDADELADNSESTDQCNINNDTANQPPPKSNMDNEDVRRSIPRQRQTPSPRSAAPLSPAKPPDPLPSRTGLPPSPPGTPLTPPHQPDLGVGPGSGLPTVSFPANSTLPTACLPTDSVPPTTDLPSTWMPTWRDFVEAAEGITDPKIRHLLNGAAATTAWAQADHISTRPPGTRTLNGKTISAGTLRRLMCDANIMPAIFDGRGQILDFGAAKRIFSVAQRRALVLRDKHCRWRGCTMPYQFCQAHHIIPVEHQGPTNIDVALLLCDFHHHRSHDKTVDVLKYLDLPEPVRELAAHYAKLQIDRRRDR